jgi:hypothetical protein
METKDRTAKAATEMNFDEFVTWATGYLIFGIGEGNKLRNLMHTIVNQAAQNPHFGVRRESEETTRRT